MTAREPAVTPAASAAAGSREETRLAIDETIGRIGAMGLLPINGGLMRYGVDVFDRLETQRANLESRMSPYLFEVRGFGATLKQIAYGTALLHQYSNAAALSDTVEVGSFEQSAMFMALMHANFPALARHFIILTALIEPSDATLPLHYPFVLYRARESWRPEELARLPTGDVNLFLDNVWDDRSHCMMVSFRLTPTVVEFHDCGSLIDLHDRFTTMMPPIAGSMILGIQVLDPTQGDSRIAMA